ncbi:nucleoside hydrolase [Corynebacterium caspium]|uniref:nucleoside hydrolase n=1 Tax=Corynebacterium caspium TaxID=234828 RepID=UPI0003661EFB|nr:nucleoside hydrolase [Corynebacterium caspium]WKD59097.1 Pyrimidine-specific ribonucleoside hydrolase RihA [Corynebacterium caspium DSM 44850]
MRQTKVILDLDTGIDDALALAYTLGSPELELIGITCTFGNVLVADGAQNNLDLLELFQAPDIPVCLGLPHPQAATGFEVLKISEFIHGTNGIGDVELKPSARKLSEISAVDFLVAAAREHGDNLLVVATGPMTNLAAAIAKDPEFAQTQMVIMGGAFGVPGNVNAWSEANISQDPEAANDLLSAANDLVMVGLDVTLQTLLTYEHTAKWRASGSRAGTYLADITDYYIKAYETTAPYLGGCGLHDPLAVGIAVDPSLATLLPHNLKVETSGPTRGRTIGNEKRLNDPIKNTKVAVGVDVQRFLKEFMERIGRVIT